MTVVRRDRIAGYQKALVDTGLGEGVIRESEDNKLAGPEAMLKPHYRHPEITAAVSNEAKVAHGASLAFQREGLLPDKGVSLTGFEDIKDAAVATTALTTISVSLTEPGP